LHIDFESQVNASACILCFECDNLDRMTQRHISLAATSAQHLLRLLDGHKIHARFDGTNVLVEGDASRWVRFAAELPEHSNVLRLHVDAAGPGNTILSDSLNGFGDDIEQQLSDVLVHFCISDFHVFLAALWGVLEEDQVDYHFVVTDAGAWNLYLGAWFTRRTTEHDTMAPPVTDFANELISRASTILSERKPSTGRVFVAAREGVMTYEALIDGESNPALEELLRQLPLEHAQTGYASQRLFFIAIPNDGIPPHRRVSRCTHSRSVPPNPRAKDNRAMLWVLVAGVVTVVAFFLIK
jgi:hypothetical protein